MRSSTFHTTVGVDAVPDVGWGVLMDFASYKEWNPVMRIEGAPEVGTKLVIHDDGTTHFSYGQRYCGALVALAKRSSANSGAADEAFSYAPKRRVERRDAI